MTPPTFRGVPLTVSTISPNYYAGTVRSARVNVWRTWSDQWQAEARFGSVHVQTPSKPTASLALRSLLTELGRVHAKLDKLLAPVREPKAKLGRQ